MEPNVRPILRTIHVCASCCEALLGGYGAAPSPGVSTIALGYCCEHHPTSRDVQAQHALVIAPADLQRWIDDGKTRRVDLSGSGFDGFTISEIASIAASLLVGQSGTTDPIIIEATDTALRILRAARLKGGT